MAESDRLLRIKYTDRVSNAEVRVRTGQEIAENTVRKRRMKWYEHILGITLVDHYSR